MHIAIFLSPFGFISEEQTFDVVCWVLHHFYLLFSYLFIIIIIIGTDLVVLAGR